MSKNTTTKPLALSWTQATTVALPSYKVSNQAARVENVDFMMTEDTTLV